MNRILVTVFAFVLLCTVAQAGLVTIDVLAQDGLGYAVTDGGKTVLVQQSGATINFKATATISGSTSPTLDSLQTIWGGFVQTLGADAKVKGNMAFGAYNSGFATLAATPVANVDLNGDQYKDVGLQNPSATASNPGYFSARATAQTLGHVFDLGTFSLTDSTPAGTVYAGSQLVIDSTINYVKPIVNTSVYSFKIDNGVKNGGTSGGLAGYPLVVAGTACTIEHQTFPEPSTLILLGMGCLALLAIRRRK